MPCGTLSGIANPASAMMASTKPYDILCSSLELRLDYEEGNHHTSNTRNVAGMDSHIDMPPYDYSPLPEAGYIRLLDFEIDVFGEEKHILGSLRQYSIEEATRIGYKALSYAWGDPHRTHHLLCDDGLGGVSKIPITANLADWFCHCEAGVHVFWIDAICINQSDKVERARQVEQMREVYRNASNVIAWVGSISPRRSSPGSKLTSDDTTNDMKAITAFQSIRNDMQMDQDGLWHLLLSNEGYAFGSQQHLVALGNLLQVRCEVLRGRLLRIYHRLRNYISATNKSTASPERYRRHYSIERASRATTEILLATLLRKPYFSRRWIIQELGSSVSLNTIVYQWDHFTFPLNVVSNCSYQTLRNEFTSGKREALREFVLLSGAPHIRYSHGLPTTDFLVFAAQVSRYTCQDPRDRIFALLGLYPQLNFKVNYSTSTQETYTFFATNLLDSDPLCLPTLLWCAISLRSDTTLAPSWVPNWQSPLTDEVLADCQSLSLSHGALQLPIACIQYVAASDDGSGRLTAAGYFVGAVVYRCIPSLDLNIGTDVSLYLVVTESKFFASLLVRHDVALNPGDLLFDLERMYIVWPASSDCSEARLVASEPRTSLMFLSNLQPSYQEVLDSIKCPAHGSPCSLTSGSSRFHSKMPCLHEASLANKFLAWFMDTSNEIPEEGAAWQAYFYGESIEFPRSRCLTDF